MELVHKGWSPPFSEFSTPENVSYQYLRAVVGLQPKASKLAPLVSEFGSIVPIHVPFTPPLPVQPGEKLTPQWRGVPPKSCLLKRLPLRLTGGKDKDVTESDPPSETKKLCFGIYRTGPEFVEAAVSAGHPIGKEATLPPALRAAVGFNSSRSMHEVAVDRHNTLSHWLERAKALMDSEQKLHDSLPECLKPILAPKRLLLWIP